MAIVWQVNDSEVFLLLFLFFLMYIIIGDREEGREKEKQKHQ